ncbi:MULTISPECIES: hypothetical protein [Sphingobacterium]|uniref:hypothetical protein n=1 Tax=Sphingobacterium TaxID=28453 RepID=UPI002579B33B|nr:MULTISPECIES: hypothetical protein [Sphingobacterium]
MNKNRYKEEDFSGFVQELIDGQHFNDNKESGIAQLVIDKGFDSLSEKQKYVFEKAISHYVYEECERCGNDIPWSEMYFTDENGGFCGWCYKMTDKDD